MKTVTLKNIQQSFLERVILKNVSLKLNSNENIAIVGENGAGKSTLLKIIARILEPTAGTLTYQGHIRTYYVPQEFPHDYLEKSIEEYIVDTTSVTLSPKVQRFAKRLGYTYDPTTKACKLLSGGQQKIVMLSVALACSPDFLLLDEPENHLDIVSRQELIKLLADFSGGILFISHDRLMINSLADKVIEVTEGTAYLSEGGYEEYREERLGRIAGLQRAFDTEVKRMRQLQTMLPILEAKAFRGKDVPTYLKRKAELAELKQKHKDSPRASDKQTKIKLRTTGEGIYSGRLLCRVTDLGFQYPEARGDIFRGVSIDIRSGTPIVLLGRNGSGKSTFLKCLTSTMHPTQGSVVWSEGIGVAYFDQHAAFDPEQTPIDVVREGLHCDEKKARSVLGMMKFIPQKMLTPIKSLSGGERMRVRFGLVFGAEPDFLILDEPTNHLDEVSWEILLEACNSTKSTLLLVTHDYEFINELKSKTFWLIKNQTIRERHKDLEEIIEELK